MYRVSWVRVPPEAAHFFDCLGCAVLLCLVCLFDLASFFLPSHLSFKNMYILAALSLYHITCAVSARSSTCVAGLRSYRLQWCPSTTLWPLKLPSPAPMRSVSWPMRGYCKTWRSWVCSLGWIRTRNLLHSRPALCQLHLLRHLSWLSQIKATI